MKYRVYLREVIEPYSQKEWHEDYDTPNQAISRIEYCRVNGKLGADWYIQTKEQIDEVQD